MPNQARVFISYARGDGETFATFGKVTLAAVLARDCPSLAVFAGGSDIALREMQANVAQGRAMLLLAGSSRNTDAVLAAVCTPPMLTGTLSPAILAWCRSPSRMTRRKCVRLCAASCSEERSQPGSRREERSVSHSPVFDPRAEGGDELPASTGDGQAFKCNPVAK